MKLPLAYYGEPVLQKKGLPIKEIDEAIRKLVADMADTMLAHNGIGIAAPQVHESLALFITNVVSHRDEKNPLPNLRVFINPKIISYSQETEERLEGCISIPGLYGNVRRALVIKVQATDLEGNDFEGVFTGLEARCILHEFDHIKGILYIDRMNAKERKELEPKLKFLREQ